MVKKQKITPDDENEIVKYVKYYVYDMWDDNNPDMPFSERNQFIKNSLKDLPFIDVVETGVAVRFFTLSNAREQAIGVVSVLSVVPMYVSSLI